MDTTNFNNESSLNFRLFEQDDYLLNSSPLESSFFTPREEPLFSNSSSSGFMEP